MKKVYYIVLIGFLNLIALSVFAQAPIFTPGMTITGINSMNMPASEGLDKIIDGTNNKMLDFDEFDGLGFTVDLGGPSQIARAIEVTTANDASGRDPKTYEILGSTNGVTFTSIATGTIPCVTTRFFTRTFNFTNNTTYTFYRINFATRCGTDSEMQVAEVQLYDAHFCLSPTVLTATGITTTTTNLGWIENGSATSWDIELGTSGFSPTGTATQSGITNPYTQSGLSSSTSYSYYVRSNCGGGNYSGWAGPFNFSTSYNGATPGGVAANLKLWLDASNGTSSTVDGSPVASWTNNSGNSNVPSLNQATASERPIYETNEVNFNPIIRFDGMNDHLEDLAVLGSDMFGAKDNTIIAFHKMYSGSVYFKWENNPTGAQRVGFEINGGKPRFDFYSDGASEKLFGTIPYSANGEIISTSHNSSNVSLLRIDGAQDVSMTTSNNSLNLGVTNQLVLGKNSDNNNVIPGCNLDLGDFIIYDRALVGNDLNKVETYLAIKYGITLGGNAATTNAYQAPTGTIIWAANTAYHYDVTSIAKDVATQALNQPKSRSINVGSTMPYTIAHSSIAVPTSLAADDIFIVVGHENGDITANSIVSYTHAAAAIEVELNRVWRIQTTNLPIGKSLNEMEIEFDMSNVPGNASGFGLGVANAAVDLRLLLDDNTTFGQGASNERAYVNSGVAGNLIKFKIPFNDLPANGVYFFTIGSVNQLTAPLPVELIDFNAECLNAAVKIDWATASEINNAYFTVERGVDALNFEEIATIPGAGNSNSMIRYSWIDESPLLGVNYYRLKQTDFDGKFSYSPLKMASCKESSRFDVYPNPVLDRVLLSSTSNFKVHYQIIAMDGRIIKEGVFLKNIKIDLTRLSSGAYFVKAISKDEIFQEKLIKK